MIIYSDLAGNVTTVPASVPRGTTLDDIVIMVPQINASCVLKIKPPNQAYLPDVICTPAINDERLLVFNAKLPKAATLHAGRSEYQVVFTDSQGRVLATENGSFNVSRGVLVDMPDSVEELGEYSLDQLYTMLSNVTTLYNNINAIEGQIGDSELNTTSQTLIDAINELQILIGTGGEGDSSGLAGLLNEIQQELTNFKETTSQKQEETDGRLDDVEEDISNITDDISEINRSIEDTNGTVGDHGDEILLIKQTLAETKSTADDADELSRTNAANLANIRAQVGGIGRTYVVDTFPAFISFIKGESSIYLYEDRDGDGTPEQYTVASVDLKTGDNINIKEETVPDFWVALTTNAEDAGSFTYDGEEYTLSVMNGETMIGAAYISETDYTVINEQAISAAASASAAKASATSASDSAVLAESHKNSSASSASSAASSASSASSSASSAASSASSAASSANSASGASTSAAASATAAAASATAAASSASSAETSAGEAETAKQQAQQIVNNFDGVTAGEFQALEARVEAIEQNGGGSGGADVELDTTLTVSGAAADAKAVGDRLAAAEAILADLTYEPIKITSFTLTPTALNADETEIVEVGTTNELGVNVLSVLFNWTLDRAATKLMLGDTDVTDATSYTRSPAGGFTTSTSFTLTATDERGTNTTSTKWLYFYNGVYYGAAAAPETIDSAFVLGLTKTLRSSKLTSFSANAGDGQYIWYCLPTRMGACSFKVGGFDGGFSLVATISFTNASGYTEDYYVYRSDNAALGSTSVSVS